MDIEIRPTDKVIPYARNPRKISDAAVAKVAGSLKAFGWRQPIVVDKEGVIIAGHTRLLAAQKLELKVVPVHVAADMSAADAKAYRLADNRTGEEAEWDDDLLGLELSDLGNLDIDIDLTGFDASEIDRALARAGIAPGQTDPDDAPEPIADPVTQKGDTWLLGVHRVYCGDSTVAGHVAALLGKERPNIMVTDPPYGVKYDADWRNHTNDLGRSARAVGKVSNDDRADWREAYALFPGDVAYVWHAGNKAHIVADGLIATGLEIRAQIIWNKNNIVIGRGDYHPKHEPCWYAVRKDKPGAYHGGRKQSTVWDIDKPQKSETGHSTQKPVECMRRPIVNNSQPADLIYDPFLGSGTTIIAAEMEGRRCYGIELEPEYCDVIVKRWQAYTGKAATRAADGREFDALLKEKEARAPETETRAEAEKGQADKR